MAWIDREGVRLWYDVTKGPAGRPPLLLTHGFGSSTSMWQPNLVALSESRTVITWDMRGHGQSDSPPDASAYSHAASVADMAAVLDACGAGEAAVGGLSLGGYLSLELYRAHRDRVRCLVLCDTGPGFRSDASRARWNDYALRVAADFDARGTAALSTSPEVGRDQQNARGLAHAARGMLTQQDGSVMASLPDVAVPTLVVVGANDVRFLAAADHLTATIPVAEQVVIPDAGHSANIDQPPIFNDAVRGFLDRQA